MKRLFHSIFILALATVLFCLLSPFIFIWKIIFTKDRDGYLYKIAIGIDQLGGCLLYEEEDWTVSSYTYYLCDKGNEKACIFLRIIDILFGKEHCKKSFKKEVEKAKAFIMES